MVSSTSEIANLIAGFYEAVPEPSTWASTCAVLAAALKASSGLLFIERSDTAAPQVLVAVGCPVSAFGHFRPDINLADCELQRVYEQFARARLAVGHVLLDRRPVQAGRRLAAAFHRDEAAAPFDEADRALLTEAMHWLTGALRWQETLERERENARLPNAVLENIPFGTVLVGVDGNIIHANGLARHLCAPDGLALGARGIEAQMQAENLRLQSLMQSVWAGEEGGILRITRAPPHAALAVRVFRVRANDEPGGAGGHRALLVLQELVRRPGGRGGQVKDLFGLTPAESEVLDELLDGLTARAIAIKRNVSLFTVQAQVRHILAKTGAEKMRDLIQMMAALFGA